MSTQSEFDFIAWAQKQIGHDTRVLLPSGDDTAIIQTTRKTAFTTDALVDTIHFDITKHRPTDIGKKAINVNVSDIAAMGMQPSHCVITFCTPPHLSPRTLKNIFKGMVQACTQSHLSIVGGDFTRTTGPLMINVAMTGRPFTNTRSAILTRSGARSGDYIFVTGDLGGSIIGKHLRFTPRLDEVKQILSIGTPTAMIDISDGLSSEIHHICRNSQVGAVLYEQNIPLSSSAHKLPGKDIDHALHDGEDFELLFTVSPRVATQLRKKWKHRTPLHHIGTICDMQKGVTLIDKQGDNNKLLAGGWVH